MLRKPNTIRRDYSRPFFSRRVNPVRYVLWGMLLMLIVALPLIVTLQYSSLQLTALRVIGLEPTATPFASVYASNGQALYLQGNTEAALAQYETAARLQPENINYLYDYGRILIELDRSEEAVTLGDRIIALDPNDPRGYALKANALVWTDPAAAIPIAITGTELGQPYAPLNGALAVAYNNIGRYQEALQRGDLAVRQDPNDANVRRSYSYPLIFTGRYQEAIRQLEQAIAINPNITAPYFELASLYRSIKNDEMAVSIYNLIIERNPQNERAYLRLCETYAAAGLFREAEPFCETALEIDPVFADAHRMQGQLRYSRRNYEGAIESFNTCIQLGSDAIECWYIRGLAHYFLGQCDDAWRVLNESLARVDPRLESVVASIETGLNNVTVNCIGYQGRSLPTAIPPTSIPPTPIGGL